MDDVGLSPGVKVVHADDFAFLAEQRFAQMASQKPGSPGYQYALHEFPL